MIRRIVVVGASLAGFRAAETLRARGFDGTLTLIGDELHRPYDRRIQFVGRAAPHDEMVVVEGSQAARQFTALYRRGDRLCACLAVNQPRSTIKYRKLLARDASWSQTLTAH